MTFSPNPEWSEVEPRDLSSRPGKNWSIDFTALGPATFGMME
jgi:hypothetical protein